MSEDGEKKPEPTEEEIAKKKEEEEEAAAKKAKEEEFAARHRVVFKDISEEESKQKAKDATTKKRLAKQKSIADKEETFVYYAEPDMTDEEHPRPIVYYVKGEWFLIAKHKADDIIAKQDKDEKNRVKKIADDAADLIAREGKTDEEKAEMDRIKQEKIDAKQKVLDDAAERRKKALTNEEIKKAEEEEERFEKERVER